MTREKLMTLPQYMVPQRLLSSMAGGLAALSRPLWLKNFLIKSFIQHYGVNMAEALEARPEAYRNFNQFFTRGLKPDARPLAEGANTIVSPVDGLLSEFGAICEGKLLQAKGHYYKLTELLGGNQTEAEWFFNGQFATFYLAPKDYHRIHAPLDGKLLAMTHVPGALFSVNLRTAREVPNLFARNERVIAFFETPAGRVAVILVGAMIVASIATRWAGVVTPPRTSKTIREWQYDGKDDNQVIKLAKGEELGHFELGSTVILLFERGRMRFEADLQPLQTVKMGRAIGEVM